MVGTLCGIAHHPDFELIGIDVFERILLLPLDCVLQVIDSFRRQDVNRKDVRIVEPENPAEERDFGEGHVRWTRVLLGARDGKHTCLKSRD
jgi:hypothetical protein